MDNLRIMTIGSDLVFTKHSLRFKFVNLFISWRCIQTTSKLMSTYYLYCGMTVKYFISYMHKMLGFSAQMGTYGSSLIPRPYEGPGTHRWRMRGLYGNRGAGSSMGHERSWRTCTNTIARAIILVCVILN